MRFDEVRWDAGDWLSRFTEASRMIDSEVLRELRASVFLDTAGVVRRRGYAIDGVQVGLDHDDHYESLHGGTVFYPYTDEQLVPDSKRGRFTTSVRVVDGDCLEVVRGLVERGGRPAVLNMASRRNPGGGVLGGAGAQEENLFRRSNLLWSLYQFVPYADEYGVPASSAEFSYPIPRGSGGIYSPETTVFRGSESEGYPFLRVPYRAAFITVPAIARPDVVYRDGLPWLTPAMADSTRVKLRAILRIGAAHGHTQLVLSAFGCGAFRNPPQHMARLFSEALNESEFEGVFETIIFAIIDDHNAHRRGSPDGNFLPFARELGR